MAITKNYSKKQSRVLLKGKCKSPRGEEDKGKSNRTCRRENKKTSLERLGGRTGPHSRVSEHPKVSKRLIPATEKRQKMS